MFIKNNKLLKKIGLVSIPLGATILASSLIVSCSGSKIPQIASSVSYKSGTDTFVRDANGILRFKEEQKIPGIEKPVTSIPVFPAKDDKERMAKLELISYANVVDLFGAWFQSMTFNFQFLLGASFNSQGKDARDFIFKNFETNEDLKLIAAAIATPLNESWKVIRYGLQEISFNKISVPKPKIETDSCNIPEDDTPIKYLGDDYEVVINGVQLSFNWWSAENGTNVNWKDDSFVPTSQDTKYWNKWINDGIISKDQLTNLKKKTININTEFKIKLSPNASKEKDTGTNTEVWKYNGAIQVVDAESPVLIGNNDKDQSKKVSDFYLEITKYIRGDVLNKTWVQYLEEQSAISAIALGIFGIQK